MTGPRLASPSPRRPSSPRADGDVVPIGDPEEDEGYGDDDDEDEEDEDDDEEPWQVKEPMSPAHGPQGLLVIPANAGIQPSPLRSRRHSSILVIPANAGIQT